jgi:hypothetical protein
MIELADISEIRYENNSVMEASRNATMLAFSTHPYPPFVVIRALPTLAIT